MLKGSAILLVFAALCWALWHFITTSPHFESEPPKIAIPNMSYWNLKYDIPIEISDDSGIRGYKVIAQVDGKDKILLDKKAQDNAKSVRFNLPIPKINIKNGDTLKFRILARDGSNYNFLRGNVSEQPFEITIDTQLPRVSIIQMSNIIVKGGAAAVVFYAADDALSNISLTNGYQSFVAFPFYEKNYFVGIIPWYLHNPTFKGAIIAQDKAGNTRRFNINFTRYNRAYRSSNIALKSAFIEGKIAEILQNENSRPIESFADSIEIFRYVNEGIRKKDFDKMNAKILNQPFEIGEFSAFKPVENARIVGLFGDYRKFSFNKMDAGESYHLGIDLAGVKNMPVIASNDGIVVLSEELGIHGNAVIIEHGYGVSSLYAHLSEAFVQEGDFIKKGETIGQTGSTGLSFGDHLHFSVLIQGIPSISNEWMDSKWLKTNINDILNNAKEIIDSNGA